MVNNTVASILCVYWLVLYMVWVEWWVGTGKGSVEMGKEPGTDKNRDHLMLNHNIMAIIATKRKGRIIQVHRH